MDDDLEPLMVEVRASTQGFAQDIAKMRSSIDTNLLDGFDRAASTLERGLTGAIRRGSLGFDDLKRIALSTMDDIAAQSVRSLFAGLPGKSGGGLFDVGGIVGSVLGLPGRATGGPVSPGRGYMVGERGPEVFVPTASGRIENFEGGNRHGAGSRDVRVSIDITAPRGASVPQSLQRSSRQVASAVRRAITLA